MKKCSFIFIIIGGLIFNACSHKPDPGPKCTAGSGGILSIVAYANYGSTSIPNYYTHLDTAFVKFGTLSSSGTNPVSYDTYYVGEPGEDHIHCFGLKCGDYFIFRTAWDSVNNVRRYGGYGVSLPNADGGLSFIVAVN